MHCIPEVNRGSAFDNAIIKISLPELETDFLFFPTADFLIWKKYIQLIPCVIFFFLSPFLSVSCRIAAVTPNQRRCWCNTSHYYRQVPPNTAFPPDEDENRNVHNITPSDAGDKLTFEVYIKRRAWGGNADYSQTGNNIAHLLSHLGRCCFTGVLSPR